MGLKCTCQPGGCGRGGGLNRFEPVITSSRRARWRLAFDFFFLFSGNFLLHCLGMEASGKIPQASLGVQEHTRFTGTAITDGFWAPGLERTARLCICPVTKKHGCKMQGGTMPMASE